METPIIGSKSINKQFRNFVRLSSLLFNMSQKQNILIIMSNISNIAGSINRII